MKRIIEFFVRQGLFGNLLTVVVIFLGIGSLFWIRREVFPNVNMDVVTINTIFPGSAPEEVEKLVTNPLEQDLKEVDGIKRMQSNSTEGTSSITIYLDPDQVTGNEGEADIQDVVDRFTNLPEGAEKPVVTLLETKQNPIIEVSLSGEIPPLELRAIARKLEDEIEAIPGVARVAHTGLRDLEIRVEADQDKLARYRVSLDDLIAALKRQNVSIPGGTLEATGEATEEATGKSSGARERIIRTIGDFTSLEDVRSTVIRANELGETVRVKDVARVFNDQERAQVLIRTGGVSSLNLTVLKKEKSDAIDVVDRVMARVNELKPTLDSRISITYINDFSQFIRRRLGVLTGNLMIGLTLVLLFLPMVIPLRFTFMIGLAIPFAFLGTLVLLQSWGYSINLVSMIGLIIVTGILVDDSIVVTENSVRFVEKGMDPKTAAIEGTSQMVAPVSASVLTTVTAFLPMAFMSGIFGKFIKEIPVVVITALLVSLFEALLILPGHIGHWIQGRVASRGPARSNGVTRFLDSTRGFWERRLVPVYLKGLRLVLRRRYWVMASLLALFMGSLLLAAKGMKIVLFPPEGVEVFMVRAEAKVGTSLDQLSEMMRPIEKKVGALPSHELDAFTTFLGIQQQDPNDPFTRLGTEVGQINVYLTPENRRDRTAAEIIDAVRKDVGSPPGLVKLNFSRVNPGPPQGKPVSLGVRGKSYEQIMPAVREVKERLAGMQGVSDISDSYVLGKEELRVRVNSAEAAAAGLSVASIGNTVRAAYEGIVATTVRGLDEEVSVRVSLSRSERTRKSTLEDLLIPNPSGNLVPLGRVSSVAPAQSLANYEHESNQRQVKVTAEVDTDVNSAVAINSQLREILPEIGKKFPGVNFAFGGEDEDTKESMESLGRAFVAAVLGIFLILVLTFKSLLQPLLILLTVPLGIIAVIWAFFLHGMPFSFMGMLGIVALGGVIVNNAIVLVSFINERRVEGADRWQSILDAAEARIRPIFLTTVTTVVGVLPTAYGLGGLDKFVVPIAMALGWGLMFGSLLTAFVFPAALAVLDDFQGLSRKIFRRRSPTGEMHAHQSAATH